MKEYIQVITNGGIKFTEEEDPGVFLKVDFDGESLTVRGSGNLVLLPLNPNEIDIVLREDLCRNQGIKSEIIFEKINEMGKYDLSTDDSTKLTELLARLAQSIQIPWSPPK